MFANSGSCAEPNLKILRPNNEFHGPNFDSIIKHKHCSTQHFCLLTMQKYSTLTALGNFYLCLYSFSLRLREIVTRYSSFSNIDPGNVKVNFAILSKNHLYQEW